MENSQSERLIPLDYEDYIERLEYLLPAGSVDAKEETVVDSKHVAAHSAEMISTIVDDMITILLTLSDTDMCFDLKQSGCNIWALSEYLILYLNGELASE